VLQAQRRAADGVIPGEIDVVYDTIGKRQTFEVAVAPC